MTRFNQKKVNVNAELGIVGDLDVDVVSAQAIVVSSSLSGPPLVMR